MDRKEDTLPELMAVLHRVYDHGIKTGEINIYETTNVVDAPALGVPYKIHVIPSLSEKPPPSPTLPDLRSKPSRDVFAKPFVPAEFLTDIDEGYHSLLNKFCFLPEQFVLVSQKWAVQADPLEQDDLWAAWRVLKSMDSAGRKGFVFANVGRQSGASQPHRHIQVVPVPYGDHIPIESLTRQTGGTYDHPAQKPQVLPLPYTHFFTPLPSTPRHHQPEPTTNGHTSSTPSSSGQEITPASLLTVYQTHLDMFEPHSAQSEDDGVCSHNVLLTLHGFHTIPRQSRDVEVPISERLQERLRKETDGEEDLKDKMKSSINGLGLAGYFFMKPGYDEILKEFGIDNVLKAVGFANEA